MLPTTTPSAQTVVETFDLTIFGTVPVPTCATGPCGAPIDRFTVWISTPGKATLMLPVCGASQAPAPCKGGGASFSTRYTAPASDTVGTYGLHRTDAMGADWKLKSGPLPLSHSATYSTQYTYAPAPS